MKTNFNGLFKRMTTMVIVVLMVFSFTATGYASQETWNKGEKVNYVPSSQDSSYKTSSWTKNLVDIYQLKWYESPTRQVLKGEFMLVQLRTIQASLERRGIDKLSAENEKLNFKDINTLSKSAQEEVKILKNLGILSGSPEGYMGLTNKIKRSEAAKVISVLNNKLFKISSLRFPKVFNDTKGHWAEKSISVAYQVGLLNGMSATEFKPNDSLTLEQTLQILENTIGYYGITRADVAKAMNETFRVVLDTDISNSMISKNSYVKYEEKMKHYGFDNFYDNKSAKTSETVTKAEAIKMAIAVTYNFNSVQNFEQDAKSVTKETSINYTDKVTYIDVISYFENCKVSGLEGVAVKDIKVSLKDLNDYSVEEQAAIKDMVANEIVYLHADKLNGNDYVFKGQLNELVVNFAEKYSTIAQPGDKINTDPEKIPFNAIQYPYIVSNVDKSVYEVPFIRLSTVDFVTPYKAYFDEREYFIQTNEFLSKVKEYSEGYYNAIFNIDYKTITVEGLTKQIKGYYTYFIDKEQVQDYVKYVKENQIILRGRAVFQSPILYYDGYANRARLKVELEVVNSKTDKNLLYCDTNDYTKVYKKNSYNLISDIEMCNAYMTTRIYIDYKSSLYYSLLDPDSSGIVEIK